MQSKWQSDACLKSPAAPKILCVLSQKNPLCVLSIKEKSFLLKITSFIYLNAGSPSRYHSAVLCNIYICNHPVQTC